MYPSKLIADRMILDLRSTVLAMIDAIYALESGNAGVRRHGKHVIKEVEENIKKMEKESFMIGSLKAYYNTDITLEALSEPLRKIRKRNYEMALGDLMKLNRHLKGGLSENFSERTDKVAIGRPHLSSQRN